MRRLLAICFVLLCVIQLSGCDLIKPKPKRDRGMSEQDRQIAILMRQIEELGEPDSEFEELKQELAKLAKLEEPPDAGSLSPQERNEILKILLEKAESSSSVENYFDTVRKMREQCSLISGELDVCHDRLEACESQKVDSIGVPRK